MTMRRSGSPPPQQLLLPLLPLLLLLAASSTVVVAMPPEWNLPSMPASWVLSSGGGYRCVAIPESMELCSNIGYSVMRLPNMLNHDSVREVQDQTRPWMSLAKLQCHRDIRILLCSIYAPVCIQPMPDRHIKPCRSLCESVMQPCSQVMASFGFSWPEILNCTQFPPESDLMCIKNSEDIPDRNSSSASEARCRACSDIVTYESIIGNYCINKVVMKARIERISANATSGLTQLHLRRRIRFFKSAGLARQQKRQLRSVVMETSGACKCPGLEAARADPKKRFLLMGTASADGSIVRVAHLVEWQQRDPEFKRALKKIRSGKRRGSAVDVCQMGQQTLALPHQPATAGSGGQRGQQNRKKNKKNKKNKRKNRKNGKNNRRKNRKNKKNEDASVSGESAAGAEGSTEAAADVSSPAGVAGDSRSGGGRPGSGSRRQRKRRRNGGSGGGGRDRSYSYDSFYYSNYHS